MKRCTRRQMLRRTGLVLSAAVLRQKNLWGEAGAANARGAIAGEVTAARVGQGVLDSGGTAIDAILSAALAAAVVSPHNCGIGGYGGHMVIALGSSRKTIAIDFNTTAPAAAKADLFPIDGKGLVRGRVNQHGWLSAGVPGVLAGIELAARRYATRPFRDLLAPAIALAEEGYRVSKGLASVVRGTAAGLKKDPATAELYLPDGRLPEADDLLRNPKLSALLSVLARENSVEPFYRGAIARQIAEAFQKNGGLVTAEDLSIYQAREVEPEELRWGEFSIYTAPLTAGGLTPFEALKILQTLDWKTLPPTHKAQARIEALRLAWADRFNLLGDPAFVKVATAELLSTEYSARQAGRITEALRAQKPVAVSIDGLPDDGTVNLSCCDNAGNLAALTLTHGSSFGAQVTVPGLGLTLGHGMSRFDPRPGRPNSIGPGKRPLHNMCPTIVARNGRPVFAVGAAGGRKIPNAIFDVLLQFLESGGSSRAALEGARCHTEGDLKLTLEARWPAAEIAHLKSIGYQIRIGASAFVSAATFDPASGSCSAAAR